MISIKYINYRIEKFLSIHQSDSLFIYSPSALKNLTIQNLDNKINIHNLNKNVEFLDKIDLNLQNINNIIAIGGGSVIDIAKYLSYKLDKKLIVVLSAISTNAFSTNKACLYVGNQKVTILTKEPDEVVYCDDYLAKANKINLLGLMDVLSIHTALKDWELSCVHNKEHLDYCFNLAKKLLKKVVLFLNKKTYEEIINNRKFILKVVCKSGVITNLYGSGRPESASEHIIAKFIEYQFDTIPHGIAVANGIILASIMQNNIDYDVINLLKKLGICEFNLNYLIDEKFVFKILTMLKPRPDRFTIIDLEEYSIKRKAEKIALKWKELLYDYSK